MSSLIAPLLLLNALSAAPPSSEARPDFQKTAAYLDGRQKNWFAWRPSNRGDGTSCISCHTNLPYALARPVIRQKLQINELSKAEEQLLVNVKKRIDNWKDNRLFYDFNDVKKEESRGTESVLNALILANYDAHAGRKSISAHTSKAFKIMWSLQGKGTWGWLDFGTGYEPFESPSSQYVGSALAAVAVGRAPGGYRKTADIQKNLKTLRAHLRSNFETQTLHNRLYALWADRVMGDFLTEQQRTGVMNAAFSKQQPDGGFVLHSLSETSSADRPGRVRWRINSNRSDGYATGLIVYVLKQAGVAKTHPKIRRALKWLREHQEDGVWMGYSVNKERDPSTHVGKFMTDAATGFGVLGITAYDE
jgi:squalene-hopene/tetraprenyl-beta-curcumene cyclase